jgi:hypothetical protein
MKNRRAHRVVVRRLIAGLTAAVIGGVGSLAIVTPSQAAIPCTVTDEGGFLGDETGVWYQVNGTITNTAAVTKYRWVVDIDFPDGATILQAWNLTAMPEYGDGWYSNMNGFNGTLRPGESTLFGLIAKMPPGVYDSPELFCSI